MSDITDYIGEEIEVSHAKTKIKERNLEEAMELADKYNWLTLEKVTVDHFDVPPTATVSIKIDISELIEELD